MYEDLLIKAALGKASAQEQQQLEEWLANRPDYRVLLEELKSSLAYPSGKKYDTYAGLEKLREKIKAESCPPPSVADTQLRQLILPLTLFRIAASLLILCGIGWLSYQWATNLAQNRTQVSLVEISTLYGQRKQITLPDGSQLWMSAGSRLRYPKAFSGDKREVYMQGEIFFQVSHDKQKPFVIHTDTLEVRVLGTSFVVRSYVGQPQAMVAVSTGRVSVRVNEAKTPAALLTANQTLIYQKHTHNIDVLASPAVNEQVWKEGHLVFDKMSFAEIARELERYYDVQITFASPALKACIFKASFKPMTLDQILIIMQQTTSFQYEYQVKAKKVIIRGKGC